MDEIRLFLIELMQFMRALCHHLVVLIHEAVMRWNQVDGIKILNNLKNSDEQCKEVRARPNRFNKRKQRYKNI